MIPKSIDAETDTEDSRLTQHAVTMAKAGDPEGIHFLYVRYSDNVLRYVTSLVHDRGDAEDITQNVFTKLMTAIRQYEQRSVPFSAWIMRVARNASLDHLRAKRPIPVEDVRVADTRCVEFGTERGRDLREALDELPRDQREVMVLRHVVGLSPLEIAGTMNRSESSIHGLHHRGRRRLKGLLESTGAGPVVVRPHAA